MLIKLIQNVITEHWKTQLAAYNLSEVIFILLFRNHMPILSKSMKIIAASTI